MVTSDADIQAAALRFLRTGQTGGAQLEELTAACDRLVRFETERSAPGAVRLGEQFVRRARSKDDRMLPAALRALGWGYVVAAKYEAAAASYIEARQKSTDPLVRARIDRILIDVYMYLGRHSDALRRGRQAMAVFRRRKAEADLAKTEVNYANVLHRMDRHPEARQLYHRAGAFFDAQGNDLAAAFCWYNEANTLVQLFSFPAAEKLYREARVIFDRHDHALRAIGCLYGLAWLHMLEGQFHIALQELAECEEYYRRAGHEREHLLCVLDRAETYLSLNLLPDARDAARRAIRRARALGLRYEGAKGAFFLGRALQALGQTSESRMALQRAADGFRRDKNHGFLATVRVAEALSRRPGKERTRALVAMRERMPSGRLPLWEALCDLELLNNQPDHSEARRRLSRNRAVKVMPHVRAQYLTLLGDRDARQGRQAAAVERWRRAAELLTALRAQLPPVDMRAAFSERHGDAYEKLIASECERDPRQAAAWLERYQTAGIWATQDSRLHHPARSQAEDSLAELALHVAAAAERTGGGSVRQPQAAQASPVQRQLEERIRDSITKMESDRTAAGEQLDAVSADIAAATRGIRIVQFHAAADDVYVFVHEGAATRSHRLAYRTAPVEALLQRWRFFVERAPYRTASEVRADLPDERRIMAGLAERLWRPLEISGGEPVLVVADGMLANLPWTSLMVDGRPLIEHYPLVMAPSVRHHFFATGQRTESAEAHIFVGAGEDLKHARAEYAALLDDRRQRTVLHDPCVRTNWPVDSEADIWHFTGHAHYRTDNPFYSYLQLADGPMFAADFRLRRNRVNLVVLAACRTGLYSLLPGDESTGLIRSLLEMGARNVVASHWAVADRSTAGWMRHFYAAVLAGQEASRAVQSAASATREQFPSAYDWAGFSLFGAG